MRRLMQVAVMCAVCAGLAAAKTTEQHEIISTGGPHSSLAAAPVTNEPFSAVQSRVITRTLADGTKVVHHGHHFVARDSDGRVRLERRLTDGSNGKPEIKIIYVKDPIAHTLTTWVEGSGKHVATVYKLPEQQNGMLRRVCAPCERRDARGPALVVTTSDLGSQVFDDVVVSGKLTTVTLPPGRKGNDQAITKTHEAWTSDEMKLILKQKFDDPRTGEEFVQLTDFSRAEPAATLFKPPAGYKTQTTLEGLKQMMARLEAAEEQQE